MVLTNSAGTVLLEVEQSQPQPNHETQQFQVGLTNTQWSHPTFLKWRLAIVVKWGAPMVKPARV